MSMCVPSFSDYHWLTHKQIRALDLGGSEENFSLQTFDQATLRLIDAKVVVLTVLIKYLKLKVLLFKFYFS